MATNLSKIKADIESCRELILTGHVLSIDPSAGSSSSLPGYAIYKAGELVESGTIAVKLTAGKNQRLHQIREAFQKFDPPDVLVLELIAGYAFGPLKYNVNAFAGLHRGVGAILSAFNTKHLVEVPPSVWKKHIDEDYVKDDEADAIYIGRYVINSAMGVISDEPTKPTFRKPRTRKKTNKKTRGKKSPGKTRQTKTTARNAAVLELLAGEGTTGRRRSKTSTRKKSKG